MHELLQSYLRRLTNLSANNRSLLLLRLISDQFIDVHEFDFLNNEPSFNKVTDLIAQKPTITICNELDSRNEQANIISKKLKKLQRIDQFIFEERGSKDLYVGWPFIRGKFIDGTMVRCPLLFFPVSLELVKNNWNLKPRPDVNVTFNKSFLLAYAYYNQVQLDENLVEYVFEDLDKDSRVFRTSLYQLIKDSLLEINFNQENFLDKLIPFKNYKKAKFDEEYRTGELKLYPEAVIGIFPQAGSYLVPDYLKLIENNSIEDIEEFFLNRSLEEDRSHLDHQSGYFYFLNKIKEEQTFTPFEIDAYQENALKAIKRGNSMVIQGPPGTGKSQLICNLISDYIARGKRVLLVCQKRVALDVVYERLDKKELSAFIGLVHDFKNDRKIIYDKIRKQIDNIYEYKLKNNSLDAIQLERNFIQSSRKIDQIAEELEELKSALFDDSECGISVKELYLTSDFSKNSINLKQEYKNFHFDKVDAFLPKLRTYTAYANKFNKDDYPWNNRVKFKGYGLSDLKTIKDIIKAIPEYQEEISGKAEDYIHNKLGLEAFEAILAKEEKIKELLKHLDHEKVYKYFRHMIQYQDKETDYLWLGTVERVVMECFKGVGPEISLKTGELGKFQEAIQRKIEANKGLFKFIKWHLFSKDRHFIREVSEANQLQLNKKDFKALVQKVDNRLNLEHNITKLKSRNFIIEVPDSYNQEDFEEWFSYQKKAILAKLIFSSLRNFKEYFNVKSITYDELKNRLEGLLLLLKDIPVQKRKWLSYLTPTQVHYLLEDAEYAKKLVKTINTDFDALCDFDNLSEELDANEVAVINKLFDETEEYSEDYVEELFQNSIRLAWIEHIETKYPILRSVSSLKFERLQQEFQDLVKEKMQISTEIALLKTRELTYQDLHYNRLNNLVTYRDLNHQVTKKKKTAIRRGQWRRGRLPVHGFAHGGHVRRPRRPARRRRAPGRGRAGGRRRGRRSRPWESR